MEHAVTSAAVNYQILVNIGVTIFGILLSTLLGVLFKMINDLKTEIKEVSKRQTDISVNLPKTYVAKNDFQYIIDALFSKLDRIEEKLDRKIDKSDITR